MPREIHRLGLDIGSRSIKAIELIEAGDNFYLGGFAQAEIPAPDQTAAVLADVLAKGNFGTKRCITAVSGRSVIVRYVTMPEMGDEELRNAIKYEANKYIPFEGEDVVLDCQRLPEVKPEGKAGSDKEMSVLLVAVKRSFINDHVALVKGAGLIADTIDVDSFALGNAFEFCQLMNPKVSEAERVVALVDVGAAKTNINIMRGSHSFFTREIYMAGNDMTEAISKKLGLDMAQAEGLKREPKERLSEIQESVTGVLDDLCHEIHLSFDYFESRFDREVESCYLSGGGSLLGGLEDYFEHTFGKQPLRWNPVEFLVPREGGLPADLQPSAPVLAIAVGLASRVKKA